MNDMCGINDIALSGLGYDGFAVSSRCTGR